MSAPRRMSFAGWLDEQAGLPDYSASIELADQLEGDPALPIGHPRRLIPYLRRRIRRMPRMFQRDATAVLESALREWRIATGQDVPRCSWIGAGVAYHCMRDAVTKVRVKTRPDSRPPGSWYCLQHAWRVLAGACTEGWPATSDPPLASIGESDG